MNLRTRIWMMAGALVCAGVLLIGLFGGLTPQLLTANNTADIAAGIEAQNEALQAQITELETAQSGETDFAEVYDAVVSAVPLTADTSGFLAELQQALTVSGASITTFTLDPAVAVAPADPAAGDAAAAATESSDSDTAASDSAATGITTYPMSLVASGTQEQVKKFARAVQTGPRFVQVSEVTIVGTKEESTVTIAGSLYTVDNS